MATQYIYDMTDVWNDAGTLDGVKMVITNTLSGAASNILNLAITGGASVVVSKAGVLTLSDGAVSLAFSPTVATTRTNLGLTALATTTPGTGIATFLTTPSSANLLAAITDETGTGALCFATAPTFTTKATFTGGTVTASDPVISATQTWNNAGVTFSGMFANFTSTASAAGSAALQIQVDGTDVLNVRKNGALFLYGTGATIFSASNFQSAVGAASVINTGTWAWSSNSVPNGTKDTFLYRPSAGVVSFEGASSALGFVRHGLSVVNDTNGGSLAAADVRGQVYTNTGASGGQTFNLPAAVAGMWVTFYLSAADAVTINPDNADRILVLTNADGDAISCSTQGAFITLVAIDTTNWCAISMNGTWTDAN